MGRPAKAARGTPAGRDFLLQALGPPRVRGELPELLDAESTLSLGPASPRPPAYLDPAAGSAIETSPGWPGHARDFRRRARVRLVRARAGAATATRRLCDRIAAAAAGSAARADSRRRGGTGCERATRGLPRHGLAARSISAAGELVGYVAGDDRSMRRKLAPTSCATRASRRPPDRITRALAPAQVEDRPGGRGGDRRQMMNRMQADAGDQRRRVPSRRASRA